MECAAVIRVADDTIVEGFDDVTTIVSLSSTFRSGDFGSDFKSLDLSSRLTLADGPNSDIVLAMGGTGVFNSFSPPDGPGRGIPCKFNIEALQHPINI